eukprot:scaffold12087_cov59-Cyclotella_meneghiniana.AAC.2
MIVCDDCMDATVWETLVRVALRSFWLLERGWNWKEMSLEGRRWRKVRRSWESGRHELSRMVWAMRLAVGVLAAMRVEMMARSRELWSCGSGETPLLLPSYLS